MASGRAKWVRIHENLPPGVVMCHQTIVAGWTLRAELVLHSLGMLQIRVNNENVGQPLLNCTLSQGRRQYQAELKRLGKPVQMKLPV